MPALRTTRGCRWQESRMEKNMEETFAKKHDCVTTRSVVLALVAVLSVSFSGSPCLADMYGFDQITANGNTDVSSQLTVTVTDAGSDQVLFTFNNNGPIASSIADVYFDDGTLLDLASITNGPGVTFNTPATPADLPGGNLATPPFVTTDQFSADSDTPIMIKGVNPGEWLGITFDLQNGKTFADTIAALADGSLRIGLHLQAIDAVEGLGGSESFVAVPVPGALLLGLLGLAAAGLKLRRMA